ncbi:MAG TPA: translation initiation factor IF-2 [Anaerolineae bacterium]|nr:translation initiation factor IF-2 [Anaerolineae bacterium]
MAESDENKVTSRAENSEHTEQPAHNDSRPRRRGRRHSGSRPTGEHATATTGQRPAAGQSGTPENAEQRRPAQGQPRPQQSNRAERPAQGQARPPAGARPARPAQGQARPQQGNRAERPAAGQARPQPGARSDRPRNGAQRPPAGQGPRPAAGAGGRGRPQGGAGRPPQRGGGQPRPAGGPRPPRQQQASPAAPAQAVAAPAATPEPPSTHLVLPEAITIRELATLMRRTPIDVIKELMKNGVMANINQQIDFDTAAIIAEEMGFTVEAEQAPEPELPEPVVAETHKGGYSEEEYARLPLRPPVVTVLGHVDHGKTSLLDAIRQTAVALGEVGGITQHIGAYQVEKQGKLITFLDTPGHEAFTAMRARGAKVTDLAVLVVAADDGVMPQTLEAIDHARAAQVPIIVALNKIDRENANPDLVKQQLAEADLVVEDYGGNVICVPVSAKQRTGIENLLEMVLLVAEMADLRANPDRPARGAVIESRLDRARGPLATLLVQDGTLRTGDALVIGGIAGRVRAMFDYKGERLDVAPPSTPVVVLGLPDVPEAGSTFEVADDEKVARAAAAEYAQAHRTSAEQAPARPMTLEEIYARAAEGQIKALNLILKVDVQGSIEPIENSLTRLGDENLKVRLLLKGTGNISESDVSLAIASNAIVIGFSVQIDPAAARLAEANGVDIRTYDIIYRLTEDIEKALKGLLEPVYRDVTIGHAEVRATFRIPKIGTIAGSMVTDGTAARNARVRVLRAGQPLHEGRVASLRRFTEDVREVAPGHECGVGVEGFDAFEVGDVLEFYRKERVS